MPVCRMRVIPLLSLLLAQALTAISWARRCENGLHPTGQRRFELFSFSVTSLPSNVCRTNRRIHGYLASNLSTHDPLPGEQPADREHWSIQILK